VVTSFREIVSSKRAANSRLQAKSKFHVSTAAGHILLKLEYSRFPGIWNLGFGAFIRNQKASTPVFSRSVDAIWTWMILNLMRWYKPRFGMTMKRLANWCADSIRLSRKWCGPIGRDELLKRIFAK
jgi:hypothetical protein